MFLKPRPGLKVRDPISKFHLPADGAEVQESSYWIRRLADGDVVVVNVSNQIPDSDESAQAEE